MCCLDQTDLGGHGKRENPDAAFLVLVASKRTKRLRRGFDGMTDAIPALIGRALREGGRARCSDAAQLAAQTGGDPPQRAKDMGSARGYQEDDDGSKRHS